MKGSLRVKNQQTEKHLFGLDQKRAKKIQKVKAIKRNAEAVSLPEVFLQRKCS